MIARRPLAFYASCAAAAATRSPMMRRGYSNNIQVPDSTHLNSYNYGEASYWDARYREDAAAAFDWYQKYSALSHIIHTHIHKSSRILMAGCGNAVMSEDMVKDGYEDIVNIDISSVVIEMMQTKYHNVPQLTYLTMDVRNLSFFDDCSFDAVIDKGTLDSLMCGAKASFSAALMLAEVSRVLKPGGVYMLITYGEPALRMPHLIVPDYNWKILLYVIPRPGSEKAISISGPFSDPVALSDNASYQQSHSSEEDPDSHYIYICVKALG